MKLIKDQTGKVLINGTTVYGISSTIDGNITPENIVKGANILGVDGTLEGSITTVTFVDYDGTPLYTCTNNVLQRLTEMPEAPSHSDLGWTSSGWNWSLANAKSYVQQYGDLIIGNVVRYNGQLIYDAASQYVVVSNDMLSGSSIEDDAAIVRNLVAAKTFCFPDGLRSIGSSGLANKNNYKYFFIPANVSMGNYIFQSDTNLKEVILPKTLTAIGKNTFYGCSSLEKITIPASVGTIGADAFNSCSSLIEIHVLAQVPPTLNSNSFVIPENAKIYVPSDKVTLYKSMWQDLASKIVGEPISIDIN